MSLLNKKVKSSIPPSDDQSIGLLIRQKEERKVEEELKKKQLEFSERMESCTYRRNQLKKKKEKLEHHIDSFRHILQDSEIRKFRATQKISSETKETYQRTQQLDVISHELDMAVLRKCKMTKEIDEYREVERFLESVYAVAPQGYLDENVPPCEAVMARYHALVNAKEYICVKRDGAVQEMEDLQALQSARKTSHTNKMMKSDDLQKLTTQLAYFKSKLEELTEKNLTAQEEIDKKMELYQQKHQTCFVVLNAIDNICESCKKYSFQSQRTDSGKSPVESRLKHIQEFCVHWSGVVAHVLQQWNEPATH